MTCNGCLNCFLYIDNKCGCSDRVECEKCKTKLCKMILSRNDHKCESVGHYNYDKKKYCIKCWNNPPKIKGAY